MWDILIINCEKYQLDVIRAYFIVNNIEYSVRNGSLVFYASTVDTLFNVVHGINEFYANHRKQGFDDLWLAVDIVDNDYVLYAIDRY